MMLRENQKISVSNKPRKKNKTLCQFQIFKFMIQLKSDVWYFWHLRG